MSVSKNPMHLDANESAFFKRELEYVKSRSYDTKYKELKAFSLFPVSTEAGNGKTEITWRQYTGVGFAKIIADYAHDFPRVDVYGTETTTKIRGLGDSYGYSIKEIRESQATGKRLEQRKADMAKRGIEQLINSLAWTGDSTYNINGFINYPGITEYTVPNDGTGSSKLWSTKTGDQINRDLMGMVAAITETTNGQEAPDTLILPVSSYMYISGLRMGTNSDVTVLKYFLENNGFIKNVEWVPELKNAGASTTNRAMMYKKDDMHLSLEIPQPFEQFDADKKGMEYVVPCHAETAGVIVYYPLSICYADGI